MKAHITYAGSAPRAALVVSFPAEYAGVTD
jgi:hypothetical protein